MDTWKFGARKRSRLAGKFAILPWIKRARLKNQGKPFSVALFKRGVECGGVKGRFSVAFRLRINYTPRTERARC